MNDLTTPTQTMSSLEIAELTGKDHRNVTRDIKKILNEAEISPLKFEHSHKTSRGKAIKCFNLPRFECDLIVSGYSVKYRAAIIKRWHQLEKNIELPDFTNPAIAARAWADEVDKNTEKDKKIKAKDQFIIASNEASIKAGEILIREFVKAHDFIHIGEKQMYQWLKEQNIIMPTREPYQHYVDRDYFTWKPTQEEHGGRFRYTLRITPRGKVWLATKYMAHLENELEMA